MKEARDQYAIDNQLCVQLQSEIVRLEDIISSVQLKDAVSHLAEKTEKLKEGNDLKVLHCKNEPFNLTLIWLQEFQCFIDNKYYACEV